MSSKYSSGHNSNFSRSAAWAFNFVNNFMQLNYRSMSQDDVYPAIVSWQDKIDEQRQSMEHATSEALDEWQRSVQEDLTTSWWKLSEFLIMKYNDGMVNVPNVGRSPGYPLWFANMIGFGNDIHPIWVEAAAYPSSVVVNHLLGYVAPAFRLPLFWDRVTSTWSYETAPASSLVASPIVEDTVLTLVSAILIALVLGIVIGRTYERGCQRSSAEAYTQLL